MGFETRGAIAIQTGAKLPNLNLVATGWQPIEGGAYELVTPILHREYPWDIASRIRATVQDAGSRLFIRVDRNLQSQRIREDDHFVQPERHVLFAGSNRTVLVLRGQRGLHQLFRFNPKRP